VLTPKMIMQWVLDNVGDEDPDHINVLFFPEDAWKAVTDHRNINPNALAFVTEEDIQNDRLRVWARAEGTSLDYIWVHETLHYILSRIAPKIHSEGSTHAASVTLMCGDSEYLEWRKEYETDMSLGVRLGGVSEALCRRYAYKEGKGS